MSPFGSMLVEGPRGRHRCDTVAAMLRGCIVAVLLAASATPAHAYEFWLRAHTIGQAYQLRDYRLIGPDLFLGRRRYTQTLALRIWDLGDLAAARRRARLPERGLRISWQSYLRIDHDFGQYSAGRIAQSRFQTTYSNLRENEKAAVDGAVASEFKTN